MYRFTLHVVYDGRLPNAREQYLTTQDPLQDVKRCRSLMPEKMGYVAYLKCMCLSPVFSHETLLFIDSR